MSLLQGVPSQNGEVRILLADDSTLFRRELRALLEAEGLSVIGEAGNGWQAIELTRELDPDVVLMDQNMPSLTGIDATRRILRDQPGQRVIFVAAEESWRAEAFRSGAEAYFVKGQDFETLLRAIREPGLSAALLWQRAYQGERRAIQRGILLALAGMGITALLAALFLLPPAYYTASALVFVLLALILLLRKGRWRAGDDV